ncbi:MAG TPA: hypothetical protein VJJ55_02315 [Candidatus Paceibacterota bacterium]
MKGGNTRESLVVAIKILERKIDTSHAELAQTLSDILNLVDRRFNILENHVGAANIGIEKAKSELIQQIQGLGMRIDDLALNRAKYSDIEVFRREIEAIKKRLEAPLRKR